MILSWARSFPTLLPAKLTGVSRLIEDVVDDLEQQTDLRREGAVRRDVQGTPEEGPTHDGRLDQPPGLQGVQEAQIDVVACRASDIHVLGRRPCPALPSRGRSRSPPRGR